MKLREDQRSLFVFYWHHLKESNHLIAPFLSFSLTYPYFMRLASFSTVSATICFLNYAFFADKHIEHLANDQESSEYHKAYTNWEGGWSRILYTCILTYLLDIFLNLVVRADKDTIKQLSVEVGKGDQDSVSSAYQKLISRERIKYIFVLSLVLVLHTWCFWFVLAVNDFYLGTGVSWVSGTIMSMLFVFIFVPAVLGFFLALLRTVAKRFDKLTQVYAFFIWFT